MIHMNSCLYKDRPLLSFSHSVSVMGLCFSIIRSCKYSVVFFALWGREICLVWYLILALITVSYNNIATERNILELWWWMQILQCILSFGPSFFIRSIFHAWGLPFSTTSNISTSITPSVCLSCSVIFCIFHILPFINTVLTFLLFWCGEEGRGEFAILYGRMEEDLEISASCCNIGMLSVLVV